jgi:hypothetical protein
MNKLYYENRKVTGGCYENRPIREIRYENEMLWPLGVYLGVSPAALTIPVTGTEQTVTVTSNTAWTVS